MVRTFIAVQCPENLKKEIIEIQKDTKDIGNLKLVEPENIHLTLKFLGDIDENKIEAIIEALESIKFKKFEVSLKELGVFPRLSYPRVLWIGVDKGSDNIEKLHEEVDERLSSMGFKEDTRFSSHFTIARIKSVDKEKLSKILNENSGKEFGTFNVESMDLMESQLTGKGPIYSVMSKILLG